MSTSNQHTLLVGRTGSGKSTLAKILADRYTARAVVLDQQHEYELNGAVVCYELRQAMREFLRLRWQPFKLVFRPRDPDDFMRLVELVQAAQQTEPHGPLVIFAEEASRYSETNTIDPVLRGLYNEGRHDRISVCAVIQVDTDIHRVTRHNSQVIVSFAQQKLSGDMQRYFDAGVIEQLRALDTLSARIDEPEQDVHFAVYPPHIDFYARWIDVHGWIAQPETQEPAPGQNCPPVG